MLTVYLSYLDQVFITIGFAPYVTNAFYISE